MRLSESNMGIRAKVVTFLASLLIRSSFELPMSFEASWYLVACAARTLLATNSFSEFPRKIMSSASQAELRP